MWGWGVGVNKGAPRARASGRVIKLIASKRANGISQKRLQIEITLCRARLLSSVSNIESDVF